MQISLHPLSHFLLNVLAGEILRSHVNGNRALLVTNDRLAPLYLEKYERLLKEGGTKQIGECRLITYIHDVSIQFQR